MKHHINKIIRYLQGTLDIYNGEHNKTLHLWDTIWDEMKFIGLNPESVKDLKQYVREVTM